MFRKVTSTRKPTHLIPRFAKRCAHSICTDSNIPRLSLPRQSFLRGGRKGHSCWSTVSSSLLFFTAIRPISCKCFSCFLTVGTDNMSTKNSIDIGKKARIHPIHVVRVVAITAHFTAEVWLCAWTGWRKYPKHPVNTMELLSLLMLSKWKSTDRHPKSLWFNLALLHTEMISPVEKIIIKKSEHVSSLCNADAFPLFVSSAMAPLFYEKEVGSAQPAWYST